MSNFNPDHVRELIEATTAADEFLSRAGVTHIAGFSDKWRAVQTALAKLVAPPPKVALVDDYRVCSEE